MMLETFSELTIFGTPHVQRGGKRYHRIISPIFLDPRPAPYLSVSGIVRIYSETIC